MKNLLLILVILITGITNAQDCNPDIQDGCDVFEPETTEFDFNPDNCVVDFEAVKTELNDIVTLFFTELDDYNYQAANAVGFYNPYSNVSSSSYNVTIETYSFDYGAAADVSASQNGSITDVTININEDKWYELSEDEYYPNNDVRALAYLKKRMLIYHELGHAVLGLGHPCDNQIEEIMKTSQCFRTNTSEHHISFPDDFPVANITPFENAVNRMFLGIYNGGGQVLLPVSSSTTSSSSSSAAATYPSQTTAAAQAPREYHEGETDLEYYGDINLTNDQLQNRIDAIDDIDKPETMTTKYGWETLNQEYFIQLTDITFNPIVSEVAAVANLTTLTYSEFEDLRQWTRDWRNDFLSKIANNN